MIHDILKEWINSSLISKFAFLSDMQTLFHLAFTNLVESTYIFNLGFLMTLNNLVDTPKSQNVRVAPEYISIFLPSQEPSKCIWTGAQNHRSDLKKFFSFLKGKYRTDILK